MSWKRSQGRRQRCDVSIIRDKRGKMRLVSKCHGREVREEGRDVAIKRKDAIGKQVSWKGSQG